MENKKNYKTPAEAFKELSPELQAHSLRVEKYADLIFMELIAAEEYLGNTNSRVRLKTELRADLGEAARYHDIGKVLVPAFYQWDSESYSPEEQALYRKHGADGTTLLTELMSGVPGTTAAKVNMFAEAVGSHHERWDGTGYPEGTAEESTPIVGRIVAAADALDHLLMDTRTEFPVATALDKLLEGSGTEFDPVITGLLFEASKKVERLFALYADKSKAIPKSVRIIRRKARRPFWLEYRPIVNTADQTTAAVEADMCFKRGKDIIKYSEMSHLLREKKDVQDLALAFILEAGDTLRRMRTCQVGGDYVALNVVPGFLRRRGAANTVIKLAEDTDLETRGICLILSREDYEAEGVALKENCEKLSKVGFPIMISGAAPESLSPEKMAALHARYCRLPKLTVEELRAADEKLKALRRSGVKLLYDELDTYKLSESLKDFGITGATGLLPGGYMSEDDLISGELAMKR